MQHSERNADLRRRWLAALSALGAANMGIIGLRQLGLIDHLPDPPLRGFDADRVTASREAYIFGFPDAPVASLSLASNVPLALAGASWRRHAWLPLLLATKGIAEAGMGGWYFERMRSRLGVWCAYCILGATLNVTIAALALPDGRRALERASARTIAAVGVAAAAAVAAWWIGRERVPNRAEEGIDA
jgi:hypothetical protein